jgi:hypothetical protein
MMKYLGKEGGESLGHGKDRAGNWHSWGERPLEKERTLGKNAQKQIQSREPRGKPFHQELPVLRISL